MKWYEIGILIYSIVFVLAIIGFSIYKKNKNILAYIILFVISAVQLFTVNLYFSITYSDAEYTSIFTTIAGWVGGFFTLIVAILIFYFAKEMEKQTEISKIKNGLAFSRAAGIYLSIKDALSDMTTEDRAMYFNFESKCNSAQCKYLSFFFVSTYSSLIIYEIQKVQYDTDDGQEIKNVERYLLNNKVYDDFNQILKPHLRVFITLPCVEKNSKKITFSFYARANNNICLEIEVSLNYDSENKLYRLSHKEKSTSKDFIDKLYMKKS